MTCWTNLAMCMKVPENISYITRHLQCWLLDAFYLVNVFTCSSPIAHQLPLVTFLDKSNMKSRNRCFTQMIWQDFFVSFRNLGYNVLVLHVSVIFSIIECISDVSLYIFDESMNLSSKFKCPQRLSLGRNESPGKRSLSNKTWRRALTPKFLSSFDSMH